MLFDTTNIYTPEDQQRFMNRMIPPILRVDSYKGEHWWADNQNMAYAHAYIEPRKNGDLPDGKVVVDGIRVAIDMVLNFTLTKEMVHLAHKFSKRHVNGCKFNFEGWMRIVNEFGGKLPLKVTGVEDGALVPVSTPVITVANSAPGFAWLPKYFCDTIMRVWKTTGISTYCAYAKAFLVKSAMVMGESQRDAFAWAGYAINDFSSRSAGATSEESGVVGLSHLKYFAGSDNYEAAWLANHYYDVSEGDVGSVFAIEHNTVLSFEKEKESLVIRRLAGCILREGRIGSLLIDTFDIDKMVDFICDNLEYFHETWKRGGSVAKLVLRPDSGDSVETPIWVVKKLMARLKELKMIEADSNKLPSWLGVIQGDGVSMSMLEKFVDRCIAENVSIVNFVFGQGGTLSNSYHRDDNSWAAKVSAYIDYNGDVYSCRKQPKYSTGKASKEGFFIVKETKDASVTFEPTKEYALSKMPVEWFSDGHVRGKISFNIARQSHKEVVLNILENYYNQAA